VVAMKKDPAKLSHMMLDARMGLNTHINYHNAYVVKRGEELGLKCFLNYMMVQLVKGKVQMIRKDIDATVPLLKSDVDIEDNW